MLLHLKGFILLILKIFYKVAGVMFKSSLIINYYWISSQAYSISKFRYRNQLWTEKNWIVHHYCTDPLDYFFFNPKVLFICIILTDRIVSDPVSCIHTIPKAVNPQTSQIRHHMLTSKFCCCLMLPGAELSRWLYLLLYLTFI